MGYRIVYGEDPFVEKKGGRSHLRAMTAGFLLAFVLMVRLWWPQGAQLLRQVLLPGEDPAFSQFQADIQAGEPLEDAVTAFCRRIVAESLEESP